METEEIIRRLENTELPGIKLEGNQRRLKKALLASAYFHKEREVNSMAIATGRTAEYRNKPARGVTAPFAPWKVALASALAVLVLAATVLSIPAVNGALKAAFFPEGSRIIGGPQLSAPEQQRAADILTADPQVQEILAQGAVIDKILPLEVESTHVNAGTGAVEQVRETWAQAWLVKGELDWGVQIDLVSGKVVSITPQG